MYLEDREQQENKKMTVLFKKKGRECKQQFKEEV